MSQARHVRYLLHVISGQTLNMYEQFVNMHAYIGDDQSFYRIELAKLLSPTLLQLFNSVSILTLK